MNDIIKKYLASYEANPNVIAIALVGSGSRSYSDTLSDYDFEVIVEDSYYNQIAEEERFCRYVEGDTDIEFLLYPKSDFLSKAGSTADIDHWPYEECNVVYDPQEFMEDNLPLIIAMDMDIRDARLKLHYFEFLFSCNKITRSMQRGDELNTRLVTAQMAIALVRLMFVLHFRWPPALHWASQNISKIKELPQKIKKLLLNILQQPSKELAEILIREVDSHLENEGISYTIAKNALTREVGGFGYREIREKYGLL